jgi:alkylhydroperoxidase/carboxymuconolactone decarboxylase family protein YurZ
MAKRAKLPGHYDWLSEHYPATVEAYERLGKAVHAAGPLDERTRALVKLSVSIGAGLEGAVHAHARKALDAGVRPEELLHAVLLAMPTLGLPPTVRALSWVRDVTDKR